MGSGWPLVGRTEEIAEISGAIAHPGGSGGLVLAGAAGVGKTRLAREALGLARRRDRPGRWIVATGSSRTVPLGAFAEFAGCFGPDPVRWVQDVIDALIADAEPMATVLGVDDAHLLDDLSALVIYQLVRRHLATVVLTLRTGAVATEAITSLWKDEGLPRIDLQPLSASEIAVLVTEALGGDVESASAQRFWRYTQGNVLYLRQLLADEAASGRIAKRSGLWVWDGHPDFSPTLVELIESNIGRQDQHIVDVLDLLSVAEPLELNVLQSLVPAAAIETAEARGVISVDASSAAVRLSHPMVGEARCSRLGTVRLRTLRGRVALALGACGESSPQQSVRCAVLMLDSDLIPETPLLLEAAQAAMSLLDPLLAVRLTENAVRCDGGRAAQLAYGTALAAIAAVDDAEHVLRELAETSTDAVELTKAAVVRASSLIWNACQSDAAAQVLAAVEDAADEAGMQDSITAVQVSCHAGGGRSAEAIELADKLAAADGDLDGLDRMLVAWGLSAALGETGQLNRLGAVTAQGYAAARTSPEAAHLRFGLGVLHVHSLYLAGCLPQAREIADSLRRESHDVDTTLLVTASVLGEAALHAGDLAVAQRWLREALAAGADSAGRMGSLVGVWLARALAMSGDRDAAQAAMARVRVFGDDFPLWEAERMLTVAWVHAVSGAVSTAAAVVRESAEALAAQGRWASEVVALQYGTQFGDRTHADRLTDLTSIVQGPRVIAASAHARALRDGDTDALLDASRRYEEFGDLVAAADAAAQAGAALRQRGFAGSAMSATAAAGRLAASCGAKTPALQAVTTTNPFTERQREIIALAASGLTNRQIAARLVMSVRTVEGHLFRASQRAGVSSREELIALLEGRRGPQGAGTARKRAQWGSRLRLSVTENGSIVEG